MGQQMYLRNLTLGALLAILSLFNTQAAFASGDSTDSTEFNAGEVIMHHVKDAHQLHIVIWHVPLPVILVDDGLQVMSSSHFYHNKQTAVDSAGNEQEYYQYEDYVMQHEKIYKVDGPVIFDSHGHVVGDSVKDFSITKNVAGMLLGVIILLWLFLSAAKNYKRRPGEAPKGAAALVEPLVLFVRDEVAKPAIGHKYERYMPFLLTLFFFIWIGNMIGLLPFLGGINFTGNIAVTAVLALFVFLITSFSGNKHYWGHIFAPPGVPKGLYPILVPIELLGVLTKPFVLMLRLFANITAGHIIILSFTCLIFIMNTSVGPGAAWGSAVAAVIFSVFMNFLELLVAFLQAYVFLLLAALYFGSAVEEAH